MMQYALKIALNFAVMRRQFGKPNSPQETTLIDY